LITDAQHVLNTLHNVEKEVLASGERWYSISIRPYRTINNMIDGLVLTFMDITYQKQAQVDLQKQHDYIQQIFDTVDHSMIEMDKDLRVVSVNRSFYETFAVEQGDTIGKLLYDLGNRQWNIPELRRLLQDVLPEQTIVRNFSVTHDFPNIGVRTMHLDARQIDHVERILLVINDVSEDGHIP
jgi:two-component system, chemotaxis family, CheB/CheR fusion protein